MLIQFCFKEHHHRNVQKGNYEYILSVCGHMYVPL